MIKYIHLPFLLLMCILISCKETKNSKRVHAFIETKSDTIASISSEIFSDSSWIEFLHQSKDEMKSSWLSSWNPKSDFADSRYQEMGYNLLTSDDDLSKLKLIPVACYTIKASDLKRWSANDPIEGLFTLEKNQSNAFAVIGSNYYFLINFKYKQKHWNAKSYGPIFKDISNKLNSLYSVKKASIIQLYIAQSTEPDAYRSPFLVFKENNEYKCLDYKETLKEVLLSQKKESSYILR